MLVMRFSIYVLRAPPAPTHIPHPQWVCAISARKTRIPENINDKNAVNFQFKVCNVCTHTHTPIKCVAVAREYNNFWNIYQFRIKFIINYVMILMLSVFPVSIVVVARCRCNRTISFSLFSFRAACVCTVCAVCWPLVSGRLSFRWSWFIWLTISI